MPLPPEPVWLNKRCRRGHDLRTYGRPRPDKRRAYTCRACKLVTERQRREREKRWTMLGYSGKELGYEPDPVVVQRIVRGDRPDRLHVSELAEAIAVLTRQGLSITQTAAVARISERTVIRHRNRLKGETYGQAC